MNLPDEIDEVLGKILSDMSYEIEAYGYIDSKIYISEHKQAILALKKKWLIDEIKIMQHQAFNVLKSAKAVGEWGDIRINQLNGDK